MSSHKRGKVLRSDTREMVYSIICYFEEEKKSKRYHPYQHSNQRAALATGLSASTISKIRKEGKLAEQSQGKIRTPSKGNRGRNNTRVPLSIATLCDIRETIATLYDGHELPTTQKIVSRAKKYFKINLKPSTLRRILKNKLGFIYKKFSRNRRLLFERNSIKAQRAIYLRRIRNNYALKANRKPVIYVGETSVDVIPNKIKGKKNTVHRYFIIHAVSETGYLQDATFISKAQDNEEIDSSEFLNYVQEKLIPNLPDKCILVMDNSPCHNTELNKAPSSMASNDEIKKWMVDNYIPFEEEWTKAEMVIHLKSNMPAKEYALDDLVTKYGHEILRLSNYNFDLNPIERIWDVIKERVTKLLSNGEAEIGNLAKKITMSFTEEEWRTEIENVKKAEKKYWLREVIREEKFDEFIMTLGIDSDPIDSDDISEGNSSSDESMQGTEPSIDDVVE